MARGTRQALQGGAAVAALAGLLGGAVVMAAAGAALANGPAPQEQDAAADTAGNSAPEARQAAEAAGTAAAGEAEGAGAVSAGPVTAGLAGGGDALWPNSFGASLLADLAAHAGSGENLAISPLSLALALTMTAQGASGETAADYAAALGYGDADEAAAWLSSLRATLVRDGAGPGGMVVALANGLWAAPDLPLMPGFVETLRREFAAEVAAADFTAPETVDSLNAWFAEGTRGMIPRLFDTLPADTRIVLGNALYMKGDWLLPFDPERTAPAPFARGDGETGEVAMMHASGLSLMHRADEAHQAVLMPFADPDFEAMLILPAEGMTPEALLARPGLLEAAGFRPREGRLALPRLELEAGGDMSEALRRAGLFASQDYAALSAEPLVFDMVVHRTALVLDETGAEAAAATGVVGVRSSAPVDGFDLSFDRPFLLALRHVESESVLYLARVAAP